MQKILYRLKGDKVLWLVVLLLSIFSVLAVYSSTGTLAYKYHAGNTEYYLLKHFTLLLFGLGLMYFASVANFRYYSRFAQVLWFLSVPLLIYTLFWGTRINDAVRWITLPGINLTFQTSDMAKLALIMYTARMLAKKQDLLHNFKEGFIPVLMPILLTCALIAPADLSSAVVLFFTCMLLLFIGRARMKHLMGTGLVFGAGAAVMLLLLFSVPEDTLPGRAATWKSRIESFQSGTQAEPYQVEQAKIAIAKGMIFGKGPGNSTQRNFLPHPYSDFIYAIVIEEYGLVGGFAIILLYLLFLYRCIKIVVRAPNAFGALLAVGLGMSLVIQAFINMGVTLNLLPVTGLTLPLISMGGTSIWFTSLAIGIILSVSRDLEMGAAEHLDTKNLDSENALAV